MSITLTADPVYPSGTLVPVGIARGASVGSVVLHGTYNGSPVDPTGLEWSWQGSAYVDLTSVTIAGGNWTGTIASLPAGTGTLTVRAKNSTSQNASSRMDVGYSFVWYGDSTNESTPQYENASNTNAQPLWLWTNGIGWIQCGRSGSDSQSFYHWIHLAEQIAASQGSPVFVTRTSQSGSNMADWLPGGGAQYAAYLGYIHPTLVTLAVVGQIALNDSHPGSSLTAAQVVTNFTTTAAAMTADTPGAPKVWASVFSDRTPIVAGWDPLYENDPDYIASVNGIRKGIVDAAAAGVIGLGANNTGQVYSDREHPDTEAVGLLIAEGWWAALGPAEFGKSWNPRGPRLVSATINSAKTVLTLTFDQDLGNSVSSSVGGFRVFDNGTSVTISAKVVTAARVVTLTLAGAISGTPTVSFASGEDAIGQTLPTGAPITLADQAHHSTYSTPAEPFFSVPATPPAATVAWRSI